MIDSRKITDLHPCLQRGVNELIRRMAIHGYPVGISSTYRDNEAQNALYAKGRTKPGNIVTNAKGGQSIHNYRLAFDIFFNQKGLEYSSSAFFEIAGQEWTKMGGEWGGSWKRLVDRPHMQYTGGLSLSDLQKGKRLADDARMPWEAEIEESEEDTEVRYNTVKELPDWAQPTIQKLIDKGFLSGDGQGLDISLDMVRMLVINDRAGLYD